MSTATLELSILHYRTIRVMLFEPFPEDKLGHLPAI
jgi:hypothetical protein